MKEDVVSIRVKNKYTKIIVNTPNDIDSIIDAMKTCLIGLTYTHDTVVQAMYESTIEHIENNEQRL